MPAAEKICGHGQFVWRALIVGDEENKQRTVSIVTQHSGVRMEVSPLLPAQEEENPRATRLCHSDARPHSIVRRLIQACESAVCYGGAVLFPTNIVSW